MGAFPRTMVGGFSLSRMIIGTNWFLGFSHCTESKSLYIRDNVRKRKEIADILEVFFRAGVDTVMAQMANEPMNDAIKDAEDRTGARCIKISTPALPVSQDTPLKGFRSDETARILDAEVSYGSTFCMPHQSTTDSMVCRCARQIRQFDDVCHMIRERGMIPGLSTHMPESIVYADESGLDVETYISIYNSMGFMMQIEVDWVARIIRDAKKPVMTIKPFAAGQLRPFQGLAFVWNTLRAQDMVTVGTMSPGEAQELIDMSLEMLERRPMEGILQETRSKASVKVS